MSLNANSPAKQQQLAELEKLCDEYNHHSVVVTCLGCGTSRRFGRDALTTNLRCLHCGGYQLMPAKDSVGALV